DHYRPSTRRLRTDQWKKYLSQLREYSLDPQTLFFILSPRVLTSTLFPYTTLFRSEIKIEIENFKKDAVNLVVVEHIPGYWKLARSEEHTSELQSRFDLVCRLLLEKKKVRPTRRQHA